MLFLLQGEPAQLPQPFLTGQVLQSLTTLVVSAELASGHPRLSSIRDRVDGGKTRVNTPDTV